MAKRIHNIIICAFLVVEFIFSVGAAYKLYETPKQDINLAHESNENLDTSALNKNTGMVSMTASPKFFTSLFEPTVKKWQVGRVSRKQYEIINMLWRKKNVFIDHKKTHISHSLMKETKRHKNSSINSGRKSQFSVHPPNQLPYIQPSTSSYIEFYYLDEISEGQQNKNNATKHESSAVDDEKAIDTTTVRSIYSRSPLFALKLKEPEFPIETTFLKDTSPKQSMQIKREYNSNNELPEKSETISFMNETASVETNLTKLNNYTETTPSDKIKFFELYDTDLYSEYNDSDEDFGNDIDNYKKLHLYGEIFFKRKRDLVNKTSTKPNNNCTLQSEIHAIPEVLTTTIQPDSTTYGSDQPNWDRFYNLSRKASWVEYPFAAVYVHERLQVHCDAAIISAHWLLASGSCLCRHQENPPLNADGRSAFVTYCGEKWWAPHLIAYVKYTVVHPKYHPNDVDRRQLFNIGVIQVASSMSTNCPNWSPITLISHQYVAEPEGSLAVAIGWGLDRYATFYSSGDLPKLPLTEYEALVYSNSCPGNTYYRKAKQWDGNNINNVYCLSLPPYTGEENDPVHGSVLLVGGKLIALYLQEERRHWGEQSAQYTGIWHLLPWVLDVAQEPEEQDFYVYSYLPQ